MDGCPDSPREEGVFGPVACENGNVNISEVFRSNSSSNRLEGQFQLTLGAFLKAIYLHCKADIFLILHDDISYPRLETFLILHQLTTLRW